MTFYVSAPLECETILKQRLEFQFVKLKLNDLYSKHAAAELIIINRRYLRIYKACGKEAVRQSILEDIQDNEHRPNSWKSAIYRSLYDNNWYLDTWLPAQNKQ
jgi:hypothetical protein